MSKKDPETAVLDRPVESTPEPRPRLILPFGRGGRGKTTLIRWAAERAQNFGRTVVLADADRTNSTLPAFFGNVVRPSDGSDHTVLTWIEALIEQQSEIKETLMLDLGGGDLLIKRHAGELRLVEVLESMGIEPVAVHLLGPTLDDLAYLRDVEESGAFCPTRTILVCNLGASNFAQGAPTQQAFDEIRQHAIYRKAVGRGAREVTMPHLLPMTVIDNRRLLFSEAAKPQSEAGKDKLGVFDRQRVALWLRAMEAAFEGQSDWLP